MSYCLFILFWVVLIIAINGLFVLSVFGISFLRMTFNIIISVVAVICVDGFFAFVVRRLLPERFFSVDKKWFCAKKKECIFYEKIGIKKWKDKVLELGASTTDFSKKQISDPTNNEYVGRFIVEANYGVLVHITGCIFGFLIIFIYPRLWFCVGLPVAVVNLFMNCLSLFILRYNLPKLHTLYRINRKREERKLKLQDNGFATDN